MNESKTCPRCNGDCCRDEVDIGVGITCGPWGCYTCGWSEYADQAREFEKENPGWYVDPCGGAYRIDGIVEHAERFGLGNLSPATAPSTSVPRTGPRHGDVSNAVEVYKRTGKTSAEKVVPNA